ncbi:hypothetical protein V8E54_002600 [Elaphomyces granulatus]
MADEEERVKAEKLAAAKKRVAQLQKQKAKKAGKKPTSGEASKDDSSPLEIATKDENEVADGEKQEEQEELHATEPMPDAPTSLGDENVIELPMRSPHDREPSLSLQSKMRSSSFRKTSISHGATSPPPVASLKSPPLPPLNPDGDSVHEVFRKQAARLDELEKDNRRLEKELEDANARRRRTEEQLEDLRDTSVEVVELKDKLGKAEEKTAEIEKLRAEIFSLQRQNSHLQSRSYRNTNSISGSGLSELPPSDIMQQLESKSATVEAMELEISNLRAQVHSQSSSSSSHQAQIAALEEKLSRGESALEKTQRELTDTKHSLTRASERAVKEVMDKTSTETLIKSLRREIEELQQAKTETEKKAETLDKKLQALGNLHRESETRHQARLRDNEGMERELIVLKKRLASMENENLRLKEERERVKKREVVGDADEGLDELEDDDRARLERKVRELEGENFDLRRGVWKERRRELTGEDDDISQEISTSPANAFDEVDLTGGSPNPSRRRSITSGRPQQHSSFTTVLSSGLAAFTGSTNRGNRPPHQPVPTAARGSLELLSENDDDEFDEEAFARAQAEEEARKRVEWVREKKRKLRDWKGWRLDLVDSRAGAEGAGAGMGEIFDV